MDAKRQLAFAMWILLAVACAKPAPPAIGRDADRVSSLASVVAGNRARLDSVIVGITRNAGDTSRTALARLRDLRAKAAALDVSYRSSLVELLGEVSASSAGVSSPRSSFPFEKPPAPFVRAFADGTHWMLGSPLVHQIGKHEAFVVVVPRGFITDFASVPQPLRAIRDLLPSTARYGIPALVHDYLYWRQDCTREQADNIMEIAMKDAGVSVIERRLVYEGLRQFGQSSWDENRRARQSGRIKTVGAPYDQIPLTGTWAEYREWLRSVNAGEGIEYPVPQSVCAFADS